MFPAAEVDDLLAMFDNVYEDAFFKTWDDVEVKIIPVLFFLNNVICKHVHVKVLPHAKDTATFAKLNFRLHLYFWNVQLVTF